MEDWTNEKERNDQPAGGDRTTGEIRKSGILPSLPEHEIRMFDGKLTINLHSVPDPVNPDSAVCFFADGTLELTDPFVEPQPRLDPEKGFEFCLNLPKPERILAIRQHASWWTRPVFPDSLQSIPDRTQMLLLKYPEGTCAVLAVCDEIYRADFYSPRERVLPGEKDGTDFHGQGERVPVESPQASVSLQASESPQPPEPREFNETETESLSVRCASNRVGDCNVHTLFAAAAWDENPYLAIRKAAKSAAAAKAGGICERGERTFPEILEGFGWCTWNAFYREVSEEGIIAKLDEFRRKNIPVKWILIDDGWMDADDTKTTLRGLDADPVKFPGGLAGTVKRIREEYGILHVGVWHSVTGYWNGIEPGSEADRLLAGGTRHLPDGRIVIDADPERAFTFYDTWHSYLRKCGIDFVKVDSQSAMSVFYRGIESYGTVSGAIMSGLERSAEKNFDGALINCMGMAPEEVWSRERSAVTRTSDDFFPNEPDSFIEHAMQNAYNSLWTGTFYVGDWDMFFTDHPDAKLHAILRAVSGGPVYVSDQVGQTDPSWLRFLMDEEGRAKRCDGPGLPAPDSLFENPRKNGILKVVNRRGDRFMIAAFDLARNEEETRAEITCADLEPVTEEAGGAYRVTAQFGGGSGEIGPGRGFSFTLPRGDAELFILERLEET